MNKRCKALTVKGTRCKRDAMLIGYCAGHFDRADYECTAPECICPDCMIRIKNLLKKSNRRERENDRK